MPSPTSPRIALLLLAAACAIPCRAQLPSPLPDMVIQPLKDDGDIIRHAHRIFLVNNGVDQLFARKTRKPQPTLYNEFYAALQAWGAFQLVDSSDDADLIFSISGRDDNHVIRSEHPRDLRCDRTPQPRDRDCSTTHDDSNFDAKVTLHVLSTEFEELWETTIRLDQERVHLDFAVNQIAGRLAHILEKPAPPDLRFNKLQAAPLPALLHLPDAVVPDANPSDIDIEANAIPTLRDALNGWGRFSVRANPKASRLLLQVYRTYDQSTLYDTSTGVKKDAPQLYVDLEAVDAATGLILWAVCIPDPPPSLFTNRQQVFDKSVVKLVESFRRSAPF